MIAGNSNDSLHKVLRRVQRITENDDVAALDFVVGNEPVPDTGRTKVSFVDQQVIADQQRVLHRFGWNLERLDDESDHENGDYDSNEERLNSADPSAVGFRILVV